MKNDQAADGPGPKPSAQAAAEPRNDDVRASSQGSDPEPSTPSDDAYASLQAQLTEAQAKAAEYQDAFLRARAEMENIRRRADAEKLNASKYAIESFAESLVAVADSLEAGLAVENQSADKLMSGLEITLKQLRSALEKHKVVVLDPLGQKFDPNQHMAVQMVSGSSVDPPVPSNHVVKVLQKGYLIYDRVLRPAMVQVAA